MPHIKELIDLIKIKDKDERDLVTKAYHFAEKAHAGQARKSGEPYFNHVFATAKNLAELGMNPTVVSAGLLHDVLEDTPTTEKEIEKEFGKDVLSLVKSVTKLGTLKYKGVERNVENLRKFFISMAADLRVIVIKLCDRLHNVETLEHLRPDKAHRIAMETLEIYAPLANRLGMGKLRGRLEDAAFPFAFPKEYEETKRLLTEKRETYEEHLSMFEKAFDKALKAGGVKVLARDKRVKHLYSLWKKLEKHHMDMTKIYDIIALRVIVPTIEDCYQTLGIIHGSWKPLPGRIKDYIAVPKPNGYRSIQTTVFTGTGGIIEIQIRTEEMHIEAEYGLAAHFIYKEKGSAAHKNIEKEYEWIAHMRDTQKNIDDHETFFENLKMDFFGNRVFVFTPNGDIINLPEHASIIDFAYHVHSSIGNHAMGAKVNGKFVGLEAQPSSGDIVEVIVNKNAHPSDKWLELAKTSMARVHINKYLKGHSLLDKYKNFLK